MYRWCPNFFGCVTFYTALLCIESHQNFIVKELLNNNQTDPTLNTNIISRNFKGFRTSILKPSLAPDNRQQYHGEFNSIYYVCI